MPRRASRPMQLARTLDSTMQVVSFHEARGFKAVLDRVEADAPWAEAVALAEVTA